MSQLSYVQSDNGRPRSAGAQQPQTPGIGTTAKQQDDSIPPAHLSTSDPLALDHQQRFFSGWGDIPLSFHNQFPLANLKTPSLGLTWTSQLAARVVLLREPIYKPQDYLLGPGSDIIGWRRYVKVAFAKWAGDANGVDGNRFEIWEGGLRKLHGASDKDAEMEGNAPIGQRPSQEKIEGRSPKRWKTV